MLPSNPLTYATAFLALFHSAGACAGDEKTGALATALFSKVPSAALAATDRVSIAAQTPLALSGIQIVSSLPGCAEDSMDPEVRLADLNADGKPEVFIAAGNTCTSGMTGLSIWLFARQRDRNWVQLLDAVAPEVRILASSTRGWRDLALTSRTSSCSGVWQLSNDGRYRYVRSEAAAGTPCPHR